jgi:hypothetical protein
MNALRLEVRSRIRIELPIIVNPVKIQITIANIAHRGVEKTVVIATQVDFPPLPPIWFDKHQPNQLPFRRPYAELRGIVNEMCAGQN